MEKANRTIRIAVVDSGIDAQNLGIEEKVIFKTGYRVDDKGYIVERKGLDIRDEHGTVVAGIINHICPDAKLMDVNIFDENLKTSSKVLLNALSHVIDYEPDIIHMSLGTLKKCYNRYFKKVIREAKRKNILLVAAAEETGKKSYPAYLKGVIGVKPDDDLKERQYCYHKGFFYAPPGIEGITRLKCKDVFEEYYGSSMSAAYITGHLAEMIYKWDKEECNYKNAVTALIENVKEE